MNLLINLLFADLEKQQKTPNMKNSIYYLIALIILSSCKTTTMEEKFEWLPSESAPKLYPMEIYNGHLFFEDGNSVYIPCSALAHSGWGNDGSTHVTGDDFKPVPIRLEVTWASFVENKFYTGSWALPKEKMTKLFKEGVVAYRTKKKKTYNQIIVGLAPGGVAVVWMYGEGNQVEIGRFQAKETQVAMKDFVPNNPTISQKEYMDLSTELPEAIKNIEQKGGIEFGLWDTYRKKYNWKTNIDIPNYTFEKIAIEMFNGERETLFDEALLKNEFKERAIPDYMSFIITNPKGIHYVFEFKNIDEKEIFNLFQQADASKPIEIVLRMNEDLSNRKLIFKQGDKEIPIKKIDLDNMWEYKK